MFCTLAILGSGWSLNAIDTAVTAVMQAKVKGQIFLGFTFNLDRAPPLPLSCYDTISRSTSRSKIIMAPGGMVRMMMTVVMVMEELMVMIMLMLITMVMMTAKVMVR